MQDNRQLRDIPDDLRWMLWAACQKAINKGEAKAEWWFPERGHTHVARQARQICETCPVKMTCLEAGGYSEEGIWGGLGRVQRRRRLRAIMRGVEYKWPRLDDQRGDYT